MAYRKSYPVGPSTHVSKIIKAYAAQAEPLPEFVTHLPLAAKYAAKLEAIKAGHPQPLTPHEFFRFLLMDDPHIHNNSERMAALAKVERELGYNRGTLRLRLLKPRDLEADLPPHIIKELQRICGSSTPWDQKSIMSSEAETLTLTHFKTIRNRHIEQYIGSKKGGAQKGH